jgi:hypothetical protein
MNGFTAAGLSSCRQCPSPSNTRSVVFSRFDGKVIKYWPKGKSIGVIVSFSPQTMSMGHATFPMISSGRGPASMFVLVSTCFHLKFTEATMHNRICRNNNNTRAHLEARSGSLQMPETRHPSPPLYKWTAREHHPLATHPCKRLAEQISRCTDKEVISVVTVPQNVSKVVGQLTSLDCAHY